jgi:hypothetical protein
MPSEREKMLAGELYRASDPELEAMSLRAADLMARYNASSAREPGSRDECDEAKPMHGDRLFPSEGRRGRVV